MDLVSGAPYWLLLNGIRSVAPPLDHDEVCDVAVIGSGISGALIARTLARAGRRTVVLDKRDLVQGSTKASTALLQYDLDVTFLDLSRRLGAASAARIFELGMLAVSRLKAIGEEVSSPVHPAPSLYFASAPESVEHLRAEFECRHHASFPVTWLDAATLRRQWGISAPAAILSRGCARMDPYDFTHRLLDDARRAGASLYDRTNVQYIQRHGDTLTLYTDRGSTLRANFVIHASGYEAAKRLPPDLVSLAVTYAIATEPVQSLQSVEDFMAWEFAQPYLYVRRTGDRLLIGGEDTPFVHNDNPDFLLSTKSKKLLSRASDLLPGLRLESAFCWSGVFAATPDGLGLIGALRGQPHELFAFGFGGNGITFAAIAAEILHDTIQGRPNPDAEFFSPLRAP